MKRLLVLLVLVVLFGAGCAEDQTPPQDDFNSPERVKERQELVARHRAETLKACRSLEDKQFTERYPFGAGEHETAAFRDTWYDHQLFDDAKKCTEAGFKP